MLQTHVIRAIALDIAFENLEGVFLRFESDDASRRSNKARKGQRMRANIGADIHDRCSFVDQKAKKAELVLRPLPIEQQRPRDRAAVV